jgi:hypothetical protein
MEPDGGHVAPAPQDGGEVVPAPGLDASAPVDGGNLDGATPPRDAECADECKPVITVPAGCSRQDRLDRVYLFCSDAVRWDDARASCLAAGTDLVLIEDEAENAFVAANTAAAAWIGATDRTTEGSFVWITPGQSGASSLPVTFARWALATPDNCLGGVIGQQDCVRIASDGSWNDSDCEGGCTEGLFAFVCESY